MRSFIHSRQVSRRLSLLFRYKHYTPKRKDNERILRYEYYMQSDWVVSTEPPESWYPGTRRVRKERPAIDSNICGNQNIYKSQSRTPTFPWGYAMGVLWYPVELHCFMVYSIVLAAYCIILTVYRNVHRVSWIAAYLYLLFHHAFNILTV